MRADTDAAVAEAMTEILYRLPEGTSCQALADHLGLSYTTVQRSLERMGYQPVRDYSPWRWIAPDASAPAAQMEQHAAVLPNNAVVIELHSREATSTLITDKQFTSDKVIAIMKDNATDQLPEVARFLLSVDHWRKTPLDTDKETDK